MSHTLKPARGVVAVLHLVAGCLVCQPLALAAVMAQGSPPAVTVRTEATTSETFPALPGPCTQTASGSIRASISGACELSVPGGSVTFATGAAGSLEDLRLSAGAQLSGSTSLSRVGYTDRARVSLEDRLLVTPRVGAPLASDVVFTAFLAGDPTGFAALDGRYGAEAMFGLFVGEWGTTFGRMSFTGAPAMTVGSLLARVPYAPFASGGVNISMWLDVSADVTTGFASGTRHFSVGDPGGHTAGLRSVQVLDVLGRDISAFYDVRTLTGPLPTYPVPEPSSLLLLGSGIAGLLARRVRRRGAAARPDGGDAS